MANLEGKTFCFTGKLDTMKRKEAEELVAKHGGASRSSVSGALDYLVTNFTEPTAKYIKAQELGVKIITEQEFLDMLME